MKRTLLFSTALLFSLSILGQDLARIVDSYEKAIGADKLVKFTSVKVTGSTMQMGVDMPITMLQKGEDKIKFVMTYSGMEVVQLVNGESGWMINPMMGSSEPVELPVEQVNQLKNGGMLKSVLRESMNDGTLKALGEETFAGKPCYKLVTSIDGIDTFFFIDKATGLIAGQKLTINQMGTDMDVEMRMSDYKDFQGVKMPVKVETFMSGQSMGVLTYTTIEFNARIDDSEFIIK